MSRILLNISKFYRPQGLRFLIESKLKIAVKVIFFFLQVLFKQIGKREAETVIPFLFPNLLFSFLTER